MLFFLSELLVLVHGVCYRKMNRGKRAKPSSDHVSDPVWKVFSTTALLELVFCYLDVVSRARSARVCSCFKGVLFPGAIHWRYLDLTTLPRSVYLDSAQLNKIGVLMSRPSSLIVLRVRMAALVAFNDAVLSNVAPIRTLTIDHTSSGDPKYPHRLDQGVFPRLRIILTSFQRPCAELSEPLHVYFIPSLGQHDPTFVSEASTVVKAPSSTSRSFTLDGFGPIVCHSCRYFAFSLRADACPECPFQICSKCSSSCIIETCGACNRCKLCRPTMKQQACIHLACDDCTQPRGRMCACPMLRNPNPNLLWCLSCVRQKTKRMEMVTSICARCNSPLCQRCLSPCSLCHGIFCFHCLQYCYCPDATPYYR